MKEIFVLKTISLHSTNGVVHIESIGFTPEENAFIEYDARSLLEDLPSLYRMCKQAIKQEEEYERTKYIEFTKTLKEEYKGKRGRPTRS